MKILDEARNKFNKLVIDFINKNDKKIVQGIKKKAEKEFKQGKISKQEYDNLMRIKSVRAN